MIAWLRNWFFRRRAAPDAPEPPPHLATGIWGEGVAESALRKKGYRTIGRRVRIGRRDEIDLVMRSGDTLVFVEVRTRATEDFGSPASSIRRRKQRALSRAARHYLLRLKTAPRFYRYDVVEVVGSPDTQDAPIIRHLEAAVTISTAPFPIGR